MSFDPYLNGGGYTDVGFSARPTRTGTSTMRLWAVVGATTYCHDYTFTVVAMPDGLPEEITLTGGYSLTVRVGEHFGLPATDMDFSSYGVGWEQGLYIHADDGSLLSNNDKWGEHGACEATEYWANEPGRYQLTYYVQFGANVYANADLTLIVQDAEGNAPVITVPLEAYQWNAHIPTVDCGTDYTDLAEAYALNVALQDGDTESWSCEIVGSYTARCSSSSSGSSAAARTTRTGPGRCSARCSRPGPAR
jgi:hypothetical protein